MQKLINEYYNNVDEYRRAKYSQDHNIETFTYTMSACLFALSFYEMMVKNSFSNGCMLFLAGFILAMVGAGISSMHNTELNTLEKRVIESRKQIDLYKYGHEKHYV